MVKYITKKNRRVRRKISRKKKNKGKKTIKKIKKGGAHIRDIASMKIDDLKKYMKLILDETIKDTGNANNNSENTIIVKPSEHYCNKESQTLSGSWENEALCDLIGINFIKIYNSLMEELIELKKNINSLENINVNTINFFNSFDIVKIDENNSVYYKIIITKQPVESNYTLKIKPIEEVMRQAPQNQALPQNNVTDGYKNNVTDGYKNKDIDTYNMRQRIIYALLSLIVEHKTEHKTGGGYGDKNKKSSLFNFIEGLCQGLEIVFRSGGYLAYGIFNIIGVFLGG